MNLSAKNPTTSPTGTLTHRVFNFGAGPATLPVSVLEQLHADLWNFQGLGAGVIEISHHSPEYKQMVDESLALLRELLHIPPNYQVMTAHGGGQMHFSMVAYNLIGRLPAHKAVYIDTGSFASRAAEIASRYGYVRVPASSRDTGYDRIPAFDPAWLDAETSYLHITANNTAMGTRYHSFPKTNGVPLVADMTSEILSRELNIEDFGVIYAGAQKNLAPPGLALAIVREDLIGHALPDTPALLDYKVVAEDGRSLANTPSTFAHYVMYRMLQWVRDEGGVAVIEGRNEEKVGMVYQALDQSGFYRPHAHREHRSIQNVTFDLPTPELLETFLKTADKEGLYALRGHSARGGVRASLYNAMPVEGAIALADFMREFERTHG